MGKRVLLLSVFVLGCVLSGMAQSAQEDWTYDKQAVNERKVIPHRYTREANVKYHKRIHRVIDVREKQNLPMHWPKNPFYNIIYEALEYVEKSLSGLLEPDVKETVLGSAEIQKVFKVSNTGKIAGSKVINGEIKSKSKARIIRDGVVVYTGEIQSIYREKNQVKEVGTGLECGISLKDFIDFKERDVIESYLAEEIQRSI